MTFLIGLAVTIYLILRINKLEERVNKLTSTQSVPVSVPLQVKPQAPAQQNMVKPVLAEQSLSLIHI